MEFQDLKKNTNLKILSLIFAVLLWAYVGFSQNPLSEVFAKVDIIGIEAKNIPENTVVLDMPDKVTVRIKGLPKMISDIKPDKFNAYLDLTDRPMGSSSVKINVVSPPGIEVIDINPQRANIKIDKLEERRFSVSAKPMGVPASGYSIGRIILTENNVMIKGPKTSLDKIKNVYITPYAGEAKVDFVQKVEPAAYDLNEKIMKNIEITPDFIFVTVQIKENSK